MSEMADSVLPDLPFHDLKAYSTVVMRARILLLEQSRETNIK